MQAVTNYHNQKYKFPTRQKHNALMTFFICETKKLMSKTKFCAKPFTID